MIIMKSDSYGFGFDMTRHLFMYVRYGDVLSKKSKIYSIDYNGKVAYISYGRWWYDNDSRPIKYLYRLKLAWITW